MEIILYIFIVLFVVLPIIGAVSVLPLNREDKDETTF